ncbi:hypothetical protein MPTA5024_36225 [Microbispora sp. ATCC PTA-5024]|nr:hypothetical protein MPTA5024_36225 [Microbispora sp. ATCC PTA-5024]
MSGRFTIRLGGPSARSGSRSGSRCPGLSPPDVRPAPADGTPAPGRPGSPPPADAGSGDLAPSPCQVAGAASPPASGGESSAEDRPGERPCRGSAGAYGAE